MDLHAALSTTAEDDEMYVFLFPCLIAEDMEIDSVLPACGAVQVACRRIADDR